jgi:hypothetical protein
VENVAAGAKGQREGQCKRPTSGTSGTILQVSNIHLLNSYVLRFGFKIVKIALPDFVQVLFVRP